MALNKAPRILIAPLDWGLGHATRCIPVIRALKKQGAVVLVAGSLPILNRLRSELPDEEILLEGVQISYSTLLPAWLKIALQIRRIRRSIVKEHELMEALVIKHSIDGIISDNRYGIWHPKLPSVIITHQLQPAVPPFFKFFRKGFNRTLNAFLQPFDEIWIPDLNECFSLSGELSVPFGETPPIKHIGWLSRFTSPASAEIKKWDVAVIVSGPEPQATVFRDTCIRFSLRNKLKAAIITAGTAPPNASLNCDLIEVFYSPDDSEFLTLVSQSKHLIVRSGYSTLMDLLKLNRPALLVPTPGQTEQEYIAKHMESRMGFHTVLQKEADGLKWTDLRIEKNEDYLEVNSAFSKSDRLLCLAVDEFLKR